MKRHLILALFGALTLASCSGLEQDPLADKDGRFKDGWPAPTPVQGVKPIPEDMIRYVGPHFVNFEETRAQQFQVFGRILDPDFETTTVIENLDEFPGATYDATKGVFRWAPAKGWVESLGEGVSVERTLRVMIIARRSDGVIVTDERRVLIRVIREYTQPVISRVEMPVRIAREGETVDLKVYFIDKDASPEDTATWATLRPEPITVGKSLNGLVSSVRTIKQTAPNEYMTVLRVDLRDVELTDSIDAYAMNLSLISSFGKISQSVRVDLDVMTSFVAPVSTWIDVLETAVGETVQRQFMISDPRGEQVLSVIAVLDLPEGASITCENTARHILNCLLSFTPTSAGEYTLKVAVQGRNRDERDTFVHQKNVYLRTLVREKGN